MCLKNRCQTAKAGKSAVYPRKKRVPIKRADPLGENLKFSQFRKIPKKIFRNEISENFPAQKFPFLEIFERNFFHVPELAPLLPQFESPPLKIAKNRNF